MEGEGATTPGDLVLTGYLSAPFRRLDKYPTVLKELERYVDVSSFMTILVECSGNLLLLFMVIIFFVILLKLLSLLHFLLLILKNTKGTCSYCRRIRASG